MKTITSIFIIITVVITNLAFTSLDAQLDDTGWYVTCNYNASGELYHVVCENEGSDICHNCPSTILGEG